MFNIKEHIHALITKASQAEKSEDAMRFSQAACNAANAIAVIDQSVKNKRE